MSHEDDADAGAPPPLNGQDSPDNDPGESPDPSAASRVLATLQEFAEAARSDTSAPPGMLTHELVEHSGVPRYAVRRVLSGLVRDGRCVKTGSRYHLPTAGMPAAATPRVAAKKPRRPKDAAAPASPATVPEVAVAAPPTAPRPPSANSRGRAPQGESVSPAACVGIIRVHPAGYGFVQREDGEDDVFVSARNRGTAFDGDRVALTTWMGYKGTEGRVADVLARGRARLTGVVVDRGRGRPSSLLPDDPRLSVRHEHVLLPEGTGGARGGQSVVAEITRYPSHPDDALSARVLQVLGEPEQLPTEISKILLCADIPDRFPDEVGLAGERAPREVLEADLVDRLDLRDRPFLTIDPENARDFDDAVCVETSPLRGPAGPLARLWVAVADVSHYVRPGTALDREAQVRGCSVYLPDRVISMLPLQLSAGICSLNPDVDRLAMVVALDIDSSGVVVRTQPAAAVIRSHGRLDYGGVAQALHVENATELRGSLARYKEYLPQLRALRLLTQRLRQRRLLRGALDFELPEARVVLGEDGALRDVVRARQSAEMRVAYRLVEDCMLAANEAVARFFVERDQKSVFRVHDIPDAERLDAFAALATGHGLRFDPKEARSPLYLRGFLEQLRGRPMEQALSYLLLRALKKATYDIENRGHFGLASQEYLHFTSPIRRYPDLLVHRLLKLHLRREGLPSGGRVAAALPTDEDLSRWAHEASTAERRAMEVEREVVDLYRACLMRDQVGQEYDGTIVGVTAFGIFVALDSPYVEGLIKTETLGSGFEFDAQTVRLASRTGMVFQLGDRVRVQIDGVSVTRRKIDLGLMQHLSPENHAASPREGDAPKVRTPPKDPGHSKGKRPPARRGAAGRETTRPAAGPGRSGAPRPKPHKGRRS